MSATKKTSKASLYAALRAIAADHYAADSRHGEITSDVPVGYLTDVCWVMVDLRERGIDPNDLPITFGECYWHVGREYRRLRDAARRGGVMTDHPPAERQRRTCVIRFRVTPDELAAITANAKADGLSVTELARSRVLCLPELRVRHALKVEEGRP